MLRGDFTAFPYFCRSRALGGQRRKAKKARGLTTSRKNLGDQRALSGAQEQLTPTAVHGPQKNLRQGKSPCVPEDHKNLRL